MCPHYPSPWCSCASIHSPSRTLKANCSNWYAYMYSHTCTCMYIDVYGGHTVLAALSHIYMYMNRVHVPCNDQRFAGVRVEVFTKGRGHGSVRLHLLQRQTQPHRRESSGHSLQAAPTASKTTHDPCLCVITHTYYIDSQEFLSLKAEVFFPNLDFECNEASFHIHVYAFVDCMYMYMYVYMYIAVLLAYI